MFQAIESVKSWHVGSPVEYGILHQCFENKRYYNGPKILGAIKRKRVHKCWEKNREGGQRGGSSSMWYVKGVEWLLLHVDVQTSCSSLFLFFCLFSLYSTFPFFVKKTQYICYILLWHIRRETVNYCLTPEQRPTLFYYDLDPLLMLLSVDVKIIYYRSLYSWAWLPLPFVQHSIGDFTCRLVKGIVDDGWGIKESCVWRSKRQEMAASFDWPAYRNQTTNYPSIDIYICKWCQHRDE